MRDGRLFVTRGRPEKRIPAVAKEIGASAGYVFQDDTPFGRRRDEHVRALLGNAPLRATPTWVSGADRRPRRRT